MKASVIISAYNNLEDLRRLLPSLERQALENYEMEVILRDDGSQDDTCQWVAAHHPDVRLIRGDNAGFSRSSNIATRQASGEVLVFVNADTILDSRFIVAGLRLLDRQPLAGGVNSNMIMPWVMDLQAFLNGDRPAAAYGYFLDAYGFADYRESAAARCDTGFLSGGGCFIRRDALDGEDPFLEYLWGETSYCEDLDLSLRLLAKGWRLYYESTAILYHNQQPMSQLGLPQLHKFIQVSSNRVTVFALNLTLYRFLGFVPGLLYGLYQKIGTLPLPESKKTKARLSAAMMSPFFIMLLPYWIYRNLTTGDRRNRLASLSFLKKAAL